MSANKVSSPSRTYVAICNKTNFDGFYCKKFVLPDDTLLDNNSQIAAWYFMHVLDGVACLDRVIPFEDYSDLSDASTAFAETSKQIAFLVNDEPAPNGNIVDAVLSAEASRNVWINKY